MVNVVRQFEDKPHALTYMHVSVEVSVRGLDAGCWMSSEVRK